MVIECDVDNEHYAHEALGLSVWMRKVSHSLGAYRVERDRTQPFCFTLLHPTPLSYFTPCLTLPYPPSNYRGPQAFTKMPSQCREWSAAADDQDQETNPGSFKWESTTFGLEPRWIQEPEIEALRKVLKTAEIPPKRWNIQFFAQGGFNKLYTVQSGDDSFMMRVSLPVEPQFKTLSEVATLDFVRKNTSLPVPKVISYCSTSSNPIGYEWILMDMMPGTPLKERWTSLTWSAKESLVQKLVVYAASMFQKQFRTIGNMFFKGEVSVSAAPEIKRTVSLPFFWGDHVHQDVPKGPFWSSRDWIVARLMFSENDAKRTLEESEDEDEREDADNTLSIISRLRSQMSEFFGAAQGEGESSILFHDDLTSQNILVDNDGALSAIVDWECVSVVPLWRACTYPAFLEDRPRVDEPVQQNYGREENGEITDLFWVHLMEYEKTTLRRFYLERMRELEPRWMDVFDSSHKQRDFYLAVENCDSEFAFRTINKWLDDVEAGRNTRSLRERFNE